MSLAYIVIELDHVIGGHFKGCVGSLKQRHDLENYFDSKFTSTAFCNVNLYIKGTLKAKTTLSYRAES